MSTNSEPYYALSQDRGLLSRTWLSTGYLERRNAVIIIVFLVSLYLCCPQSMGCSSSSPAVGRIFALSPLRFISHCLFLVNCRRPTLDTFVTTCRRRGAQARGRQHTINDSHEDSRIQKWLSRVRELTTRGVIGYYFSASSLLNPYQHLS